MHSNTHTCTHAHKSRLAQRLQENSWLCSCLHEVQMACCHLPSFLATHTSHPSSLWCSPHATTKAQYHCCYATQGPQLSGSKDERMRSSRGNMVKESAMREARNGLIVYTKDRPFSLSRIADITFRLLSDSKITHSQYVRSRLGHGLLDSRCPCLEQPCLWWNAYN